MRILSTCLGVCLCLQTPVGALRPIELLESAESNVQALEQNLRQGPAQTLNYLRQSAGLEDKDYNDPAVFMEEFNDVVMTRLNHYQSNFLGMFEIDMLRRDWSGAQKGIRVAAQTYHGYFSNLGRWTEDYDERYGTRWQDHADWNRNLRMAQFVVQEVIQSIGARIAALAQDPDDNRAALLPMQIETLLRILQEDLVGLLVPEPIDYGQFELSNEHLERVAEFQDVLWKHFQPFGEEPLASHEMSEFGLYAPSRASHAGQLLERAGVGPDDIFWDTTGGLGHIGVLASIGFGVRENVVTEIHPDIAQRADELVAHFEGHGLVPGSVTVQNTSYTEGPVGRATAIYMYPPSEEVRFGFDQWITEQTIAEGTRVIINSDAMLANAEAVEPYWPRLYADASWQMQVWPESQQIIFTKVGLEEQVPMMETVPWEPSIFAWLELQGFPRMIDLFKLSEYVRPRSGIALPGVPALTLESASAILAELGYYPDAPFPSVGTSVDDTIVMPTSWVQVGIPGREDNHSPIQPVPLSQLVGAWVDYALGNPSAINIAVISEYSRKYGSPMDKVIQVLEDMGYMPNVRVPQAVLAPDATLVLPTVWSLAGREEETAMEDASIAPLSETHTQAKWMDHVRSLVGEAMEQDYVELLRSVYDLASADRWGEARSRLEFGAQRWNDRFNTLREAVPPNAAHQAAWRAYSELLTYQVRFLLQEAHAKLVSLTDGHAVTVDDEYDVRVGTIVQEEIKAIGEWVIEFNSAENIPNAEVPFAPQVWTRMLALQDLQWQAFGPAGEPLAQLQQNDFGGFGASPAWDTVQLLGLAEVTEGSVVWDPFAGTGHVLAAASEVFGANVVGGDIDAAKVEAGNQWLGQLPERTDQIRALEVQPYQAGPVSTATHVYVFVGDALRREFVDWFLEQAFLPGVQLVFLSDVPLFSPTEQIRELLPQLSESSDWQLQPLVADVEGFVFTHQPVSPVRDAQPVLPQTHQWFVGMEEGDEAHFLDYVRTGIGAQLSEVFQRHLNEFTETLIPQMRIEGDAQIFIDWAVHAIDELDGISEELLTVAQHYDVAYKSDWASNVYWQQSVEFEHSRRRGLFQHLYALLKMFRDHPGPGTNYMSEAYQTLEVIGRSIESLVTVQMPTRQMVPPEEWPKLYALKEHDWQYFEPRGSVELPEFLNTDNGQYASTNYELLYPLMKANGVGPFSLLWDPFGGFGRGIAPAATVLNAPSLMTEINPDFSAGAQAYLSNLIGSGVMPMGKASVLPAGSFETITEHAPGTISRLTHIYAYPPSEEIRLRFDAWLNHQDLAPGLQMLLQSDADLPPSGDPRDLFPQTMAKNWILVHAYQAPWGLHAAMIHNPSLGYRPEASSVRFHEGFAGRANPRHAPGQPRVGMEEGVVYAHKRYDVPAHSVTAPTAVNVFVQQEGGLEQQPDWLAAAQAQLNQNAPENVVFIARPLSELAGASGPSVVIQQMGMVLPEIQGVSPVVVQVRRLQDIQQLDPGWMFALAMSENLRGQVIQPVIGWMTYETEAGERSYALFV